MDDKLQAAVESAAASSSPSASCRTKPNVPTDYSLMLLTPGPATLYRSAATRTTTPVIGSISVAEARDRDQPPFQVRGTDGQNWRVGRRHRPRRRPAQRRRGHRASAVPGRLSHGTRRPGGGRRRAADPRRSPSLIATWTVSRSFRPLARVEKTAAAIAAGDLSRRVEIENPDTEVGRLGSSLNAMLAHIESAFAARTASEARMRRFAADASHELRTPLVTIRGFSELYRHGALSTPRMWPPPWDGSKAKPSGWAPWWRTCCCWPASTNSARCSANLWTCCCWPTMPWWTPRPATAAAPSP